MIQGSIVGLIKEDARSVDHRSYGRMYSDMLGILVIWGILRGMLGG